MISVCVATYNGEKYIGEQLESILSQLGTEDEVIVSDDESTDNTQTIVKHFHDPRIRLIAGPGKHSLILNFEHALQVAKGDYIFLADQDDVWKKNKVEVCLKWLKTYDCVVSDAYVTNEQLCITHRSLFYLMHVKSNRIYNLFFKNGYTGCCMAFTRSVRDSALPFPKDIPMHDIWIGNVAAYRFRVKFIADQLIYFRRHDAANSCNGKGSKYSRWQQLMFRWNIIKNLW